MRELRSGVERRGRKRKQEKDEEDEEGEKGGPKKPQKGAHNRVEVEAIASRTRGRRAAAAKAAEAAANDKKNLVPPEEPLPKARRVEAEEAVPGEGRKADGKKPMGDYNSGGKSNDKGHASDDESTLIPIPDSVSVCLALFFLSFCYYICGFIACSKNLWKKKITFS